MQWKSTCETSGNVLNMENRGRQKDRGKGSGNCGNSRKGRSKSKKCTFIGYGVNDFGYRLWDYENNKIIRSRDVIFNEKVMYKDQLQGKK